ncbi:hypothetical protein ABT263_21345 [Kitasatospora sp. NPDC001603]|uniref:hypothetical protein n=1 Tax=Kitasatospora sp. NPDC001603 TaxID=3154388 RepID=UPI00332D18CF
MGMPLPAGHVLVRLHDGPREVAVAVLDALEISFPTHTGRGESHQANVWEDPPIMRPGTTAGAADSELPAVWSQTFDPVSARADQGPITLPGGITADVLGAPDVAFSVVRVLGELFHAEEEGMIRRGPEVEIQLRLGPRGTG